MPKEPPKQLFSNVLAKLIRAQDALNEGESCGCMHGIEEDVVKTCQRDWVKSVIHGGDCLFVNYHFAVVFRSFLVC